MPDISINNLQEATQIDQAADLFLLSQNGSAKKLKGSTLRNFLAAWLDGHGGIADIEYTAPESGSLNGTLAVILADGTEREFAVTNGKGISSVTNYYARTANSTQPSSWQTTVPTLTAQYTRLAGIDSAVDAAGKTADATAVTGTKIYIAGVTAQGAKQSPKSSVNCFVGTDNELYSNGGKVAKASDLTSHTGNHSKLLFKDRLQLLVQSRQKYRYHRQYRYKREPFEPICEQLQQFDMDHDHGRR